MPSSPVTKKIDALPENWKEIEKVIIPDDNTVHYYRVGFTEAIKMSSTERCMKRYGLRKYSKSDYSFQTQKPYAWLECCYIDEDVLDEERWYQVEEMTEEHKSILDTIKAVLGISFHDKIGV